jgi:hypothetical protein
MSQYNPRCTCNLDLRMILHLHCSGPLGVPFYIRGSKRDINNCVLLLRMHLPCGLNIELLEVKNVSTVKFMSSVF